ncbi:rhodanese-like domain-containing protein [Terrilactibacillus laevilacticus]|uniref:Rhodanese-like domain-containing protein n=1 Tax=Terrilactibacillus laevilacticus TaxID=1380157 RepID=A0ABW5PSZ4_9BACI|nr:rhodanese-like domain-containing protein [Terrilactibacillus laevilacticus]
MAENVQIIQPEQLDDMLKNHEDVSVIDVRENEEVEMGKIPTSIHIRLAEIPERYEELDRSKQHVVVCRSGRRSEMATEFLQEHGFKAKNMVGGMLKWHGEVE